MRKLVRVVVDTMGGDYAPVEPVKGAVDALKRNNHILVYLVGQRKIIHQELSQYIYPKDRLEIVSADEVIETWEPPVNAIQRKKNSSLVVGLTMVHKGMADAFVSSGNTGALLVGGQAIVRKVKGVERAPLAPLIPTEKSVALLIDCGATVNARPSHLVQFAMMGSIYMETIMRVKNPRVALVNIGAEEEKGNELVKETFLLLKEKKNINFIGNIEARDIPKGVADVLVTEAFVGNVILKLYEGVGTVLINRVKSAMMVSLRSKLGALLLKPVMKQTLKIFDVSEYGGAPLLGLQGGVVKTHGSAKAVHFKNSILQCIQLKDQDLSGKIQEYFSEKA
ncbi:MAG: phosphate acyltransferase PlsX [Lachnospiraceae bacterium]|nr:phosphate acyltransferase PlsX [Lachnospiraceae bacterium]